MKFYLMSIAILVQFSCSVYAVTSINTVKKPQDLRNIPEQTQKSVFVESLQQKFTYTPGTTELENNVTVVGQWVMNKPKEYKASWFADKNSSQSQSEHLQTGYDYAVSKNIPFTIDGVFVVDARAQKYNSAQNNKAALVLRSNSTLRFESGAKIKTLKNDYPHYTILVARNVSNVNVVSPILIGDRVEHSYAKDSSHEWGYGIAVYDGVNNIKITKPTIEDTTGDGIYIGREWGSTTNAAPKNILITDANINRVRRNGITLSSGENVRILRPVIKDISPEFNSVPPASAIDVEPEESLNTPASSIKNAVIDSLTAIRVQFPIQLSISDKNRTIDVKYIGNTKLIDSKSDVSIFVYDNTSDQESTKGQFVIDNLSVQGSAFTPNLSLKQNNFKVKINKLKVEKDMIFYVIGDAQKINRYRGFSIKKIIAPKGVKASYNFDYAVKKPNKLSKPAYSINYPIDIKP